jgi:hypothetical protein
MHISTASPARARRVLVWIGLALTLLVLAALVYHTAGDIGLFEPMDFAMYWASGRLNAMGENPYDPEQLFELEKQTGRKVAQPFFMFSPPWMLTLVMPFGLLPSRTGQFLWLLLHFVVLIASTDCLWLYFDGPRRYRWLAWLLGICFGPSLILLLMGQTASLVLLGVSGFLVLERRQRDFAAGAVQALASIKPHLSYLFEIAVLLWCLERRRWRVLLGGGCVLAGMTLIPLLCNPHVIEQYVEALERQPPSAWITPTLGTGLRLCFGTEHAWLQFLPMVLGVAWFGYLWARRHASWEWKQETSMLILVSFVTVPYGAWSHDYAVMLVPVVDMGVRMARQAGPIIKWLSALGFLAVNLFVLIEPVELLFIWLAPMLLLAFWLLEQHLARLTAKA